METPVAARRKERSQFDKEDPRLQEALHYFKQIDGKPSAKERIALSLHVATIQSIGLSRGIPAEGIDILLRLALSGHLANSVSISILKCLLPATEISEDTLISAVSLFCLSRTASSIQTLFLRWLISVLDFIPCKDILASFYNFFFCMLHDDQLCPYLCHLLYLLTKKEHVRAYKVRILLELQSKKGLQPHLLGLLSIYKVFCPELVSLILPSRVKMYFRNSNLLFASEMKAIIKRKTGDPFCDLNLASGGGTRLSTQSSKRKWNSNPYMPLCSSSLHSGASKDSVDFLSKGPAVPLEKVQTFAHLLENILRHELPVQMGCVLNRPLLLHYVNCIKEDDSLLRLNYWLAFTLHEECAWYNGKRHCKEEVVSFLDTVVAAQEFLQEGLPGSEEFLCRCLPHWNGIHRPQILNLLSWIPLYSFIELKGFICDILTNLFVPASLYFKLDVLKALKEMLQNWMVKHSVFLVDVANENDTMSDLMTSVENMIQFTGHLCTLALQMHKSPLLLQVVLDFYTFVSDLYMVFSLPFIVLPPPGVFYPALLCTDCVNLNQLCYVMSRYRVNLMTAKRDNQQKTGHILLNISNQTIKLYNQYLTAMVGCLWTSQTLSHDTHPQGIRIDPDILEKTGVPYSKKTFNIVFHPALMTLAASFLHETLSEEKMFHLHHFKGQQSDEYIEFLSNEGLKDLKLFLETSVIRVNSKNKDRSDIQSPC